MARLAISNKQINRLVRTFLWRRVTERALHGSSSAEVALCASSSSGCSVLGMVGDPEEELWTETASFASSSAIVASVAAGEDRVRKT